MSEPTEKDRAEARDVVLTPRIERLPCGHFGSYDEIIRCVALALSAAREEGRRQGLEEAASVASEHAQTCYSDLCCRPDAPPVWSHANVIERDVRALMPKEPKCARCGDDTVLPRLGAPGHYIACPACQPPQDGER